MISIRKYKLDSIFNPTAFNSLDTMASFNTPFSKNTVVEKIYIKFVLLANAMKTALSNSCVLTACSCVLTACMGKSGHYPGPVVE